MSDEIRSGFRKLFYVPLEAYQDRYTYQLRDWAIRQFVPLCDAAKTEFIIIDSDFSNGNMPAVPVANGQVLDVFRRPLHALEQNRRILHMLANGEFSNRDFLLFEDMYHPGIDQLFYAFSQFDFGGKFARLPRIAMRCLAQTIDPDDYLYYTNRASWMRHYERMVLDNVHLLFAASKEMLGFMRVAGWNRPTVVTGLPFCKKEVLQRVHNNVKPFSERFNRVVFASRIADEKQPNFLGALALLLAHNQTIEPRIAEPIEFVVLSGTKIKRNNWRLFDEAVDKGALTIAEGLSKDKYYEFLNDSRVLFNCSLQDWVSNTASEADTLGCNLVFPAYRSFPEAFENDRRSLYVPWSLEDAYYKVRAGLRYPFSNQGQFSDRQNETNAKTFEAMYNQASCIGGLDVEMYPVDDPIRSDIVSEIDLEMQMETIKKGEGYGNKGW